MKAFILSMRLTSFDFRHLVFIDHATFFVDDNTIDHNG